MKMEPRDFCYWLQGFSELTPEPPTMEQWDSIKQHLSTVFKKVTPPAPGQVGVVVGPDVPKPRPYLPGLGDQRIC